MLTVVLLCMLQMKVPDAASFVGQPKGMWFGREPSRINTELNLGAK